MTQKRVKLWPRRFLLLRSRSQSNLVIISDSDTISILFKNGLKRKRFNIACVSCPTLYKYLHKYLKELKSHPELPELGEETAGSIDIKVFEYDQRFNIYGEDFVFYDYKNVRIKYSYRLSKMRLKFCTTNIALRYE